MRLHATYKGYREVAGWQKEVLGRGREVRTVGRYREVTVRHRRGEEHGIVGIQKAKAAMECSIVGG